MPASVNLSQPLVTQLQHQATSLGISVNELAEKLIYQSLAQLEFSKQLWQDSPDSTTDAPGKNSSLLNGANYDGSEEFSVTEQPSLTELIAEIKSTPRNEASIHPATGTLDDVLAALKASPPATPPLSPEEWEAHWWPIRKEMRESDQRRQARIDFQKGIES